MQQCLAACKAWLSQYIAVFTMMRHCKKTVPCVCDRDGTFGLGVADGVYMWKQKGIDSGLFSRSLMRYAREAIMAGERDPAKGRAS